MMIRSTTAHAHLLASVLALALLSAGCSLDDLLGSDVLPPDVTDPAKTETAAGARAAYNGTLVQLRGAFAASIPRGGGGGDQSSSVVAIGGLLADELHTSLAEPAEETRFLPDGVADATIAGAYSRLHRTRNQAGQAIRLLTAYDSAGGPLIGHAYAIQGYTEIFLADLFCSGVPLSTLDFDGDFTLVPGSTTEQVYTRAIAHFDSAAGLVGDSTRFAHLASIGRARALLALGRFADAAAAVADVPDDYSYRVNYTASTFDLTWHFARLEQSSTRWNLAVADRKGLNGLDYITSGDPRVRVTPYGTNTRGITINHPDKFGTDGSGFVVLASGVEARLIEAEAALDAGDVPGWLGILNDLRATAWTTIRPAAAGPLPALEDPGTDATRVDLLFRERAFWLFLTGQRQGDLRRLIRHYGREVNTVYPQGAFPGPNGLSYGSDIDLPLPLAELVANPHVSGCLQRGA